MKIDLEIMHKDLAGYVKDHLSFIHVEKIRTSAITILIMYDIPLFLGLIMIYKLEFMLAFLPFILILHIWGIRLAIKNPYSTQLEMILFMGIWGVLGAITLIVLINGMSYFTLHITSIFYYIVINLASILLTCYLVKYQIDKYTGDLTKEREHSNQVKYMGLLTIAPALGYIVTQGLRDTVILQVVLALISMYIFLIFMVYAAAKFLHRFFFIKKNMKYVKYYPISDKEKKKILKQGVEIK